MLKDDWRIKELEEARDSARAELLEIDKRNLGRLDRATQAAWDDAQARYQAADRDITERRRGMERLRQLAQNPANREAGSDPGNLVPPHSSSPPDIRARTLDALSAIDREHNQGTLGERAAVSCSTVSSAVTLAAPRPPTSPPRSATRTTQPGFSACSGAASRAACSRWRPHGPSSRTPNGPPSGRSATP